MDPFTLSLALGCALTFATVDRAMTAEEGEAPDGLVYRSVTLTDAHGRRHTLERGGLGLGFSPAAYFKAGVSPDRLFASYVGFAHLPGHDTSTVHFVSATTCALARFVRVRDGAEVDPGRYDGWQDGHSHTVRMLQRANQYEPALPEQEAKRANPKIDE